MKFAKIELGICFQKITFWYIRHNNSWRKDAKNDLLLQLDKPIRKMIAVSLKTFVSKIICNGISTSIYHS